MTKEEMKLYEYYRSIPIGKSNAVSRGQLCSMWGTNDRTVRLIIADIRSNCRRLGMAYYVLSDSHGKGYWKSGDHAEIRAFNAQMLSRIMSILPALENAKQYIGDRSQQDLFGGRYQ